jgi:hypothetical protein
MDKQAIREKFGGDYLADEHTFVLGSDHRFGIHFAERYYGRTILETCTGAGFITIQLAKTAKHVYTVEINPAHQKQAIANLEIAGLSDRVTFIEGSILDQTILNCLPEINGAFIDPDWAVNGPDHDYCFINSNTQPAADALLERILTITPNVAMVLPPATPTEEFGGLPDHEIERLYIGKSLELLCLYFGELIRAIGNTQFRI